MTPIPVGPNVAGTAVVDPLVDLQNLSDPRRVPHELPHYLMKLLLARLPENRKVELSLHLYPKALELMAQNNLTTGNNNLKLKLLVPFSSCLFKYRAHFFGMSGVVTTKKVTFQVVVEDPLLNPYQINQPVNCFYLLKLLLARLPISDRSKVTNPLLVLAIFYMHQHNLWTELLPFNPIWSPMMKRSTGVKLHDSKSTIPVSSAATPIKNITPPVNVPAKTGVITTTPVSEKQKPSPPGSSLKECYGNLPYSKPKEAPFTPLKKYDWCAPPMVPVAPTPTFPPMCQQSIQRNNSGHAMLASFTPLKEDDWCVPPMVFVPPTSSTFPPMSQQSIQRNNSGNAKVAPFTPLIEYDWCAPPMVPFAPSTSLPRSQQSKQDSKATFPVSRATPVKNVTPPANVPAKPGAIITTSVSEKPKSLPSDASINVCKNELPNPKVKKPTTTCLRQPAGDLTDFDWSAPCSPPQSKQSNQPYKSGNVSSSAATFTAVTDGPIDWAAPPLVDDSARSDALVKSATTPINVSAKTFTSTTSVSEKPKSQDKFAGFDWGSLPTVPAAQAPSTSTTQFQHSNQHYNSCNANALSLAITPTIPVTEKPKPNPIDASLKDGKSSYSIAKEVPFTPLKREEFADFDWCSPPTVPATLATFPPQSQQSKQDLKATVPVCSVAPVTKATPPDNVPAKIGATNPVSEKPNPHSIDLSIKVCKGEMLHSKAIEAATHTAGDFSGFDWSARSPTSPPPSIKVPTPSTSSTQSQQSNQRYKSGNDNAPSSTISSTTVTDGPIDWSAAPRVDDSEAEASTELRPSFQIVPECVDSVYDDEHSQQDPIILKSQEKVAKNVKMDPFASHKTFCLLCATSEHSMVDCPETPPSKMVRIVDLKLCAKCLSPGHLASNCTERVVCATCGLDHFEYIYHWSEIVELTKKLKSKVPANCAAPVKNTTPSANVPAVTSAFTIPVFEKPKPKPDESKAAGHFCLPKAGFDWSAPASFLPPSTVQTPSAPTTSPPQSQQLNQRNNSDNGNAPSSAAEASTEKDKEVVKNVEVDPFASHKTFCLLCATSEHSMVDCPETPPAKMIRIGELKLCSKCLSPGHLASDCSELVLCATCGLDHFDYIYHKPTGDWTLNSTWKQISVSSDQIVASRERPISQVSNVSTVHLDITNGGDDVQPSKRHFHESVPGNSSYADLEDFLCLADRSDTTIPTQLISTPQLLISFD